MLINRYICIERFVILLLLLKMNGIILGNEHMYNFQTATLKSWPSKGRSNWQCPLLHLNSSSSPSWKRKKREREKQINKTKQKQPTTWHWSLAWKNLFPQTSSCTLANTACDNQPFFATGEHYRLRVPIRTPSPFPAQPLAGHYLSHPCCRALYTCPSPTCSLSLHRSLPAAFLSAHRRSDELKEQSSMPLSSSLCQNPEPARPHW